MRIILADDQPQVRSALRLLLEQEPKMKLEVVAEVEDVTSLLESVRKLQPDVILLDWELPGLPGRGILSVLRKRSPHLKVIALSSRPEANQAAVLAGVEAFVSKGDPPEQLLISLGKIWKARSVCAAGEKL